MVKFIPVDLTLDLRSRILRNGKPLIECTFPTDQVEGVFHLAFYVDEKIASIASFCPNNYKDSKELGYQLSGMATEPQYTGKGYGRQLIEFAVEYIKNTNAQYIWCNSSSSAIKFYQKLGFELVSEEVKVEGIEPYYEMILKLY